MTRSTMIALAASVAALGCGTDPEGHSDLALSTATWDFGSVAVGARSAPLRITVTNSGTGETGALTVTIGGGPPEEFSLASDECSGRELGGGATCLVDVELLPASFGTHEAVLTVSEAGGGRIVASLRGTGTIAGSGFTLTPVLGNFAETIAGQTGATRTFVVQNGTRTGSGVLSVTIGGAGAASYRIARDLCGPSELAPTASWRRSRWRARRRLASRN